MPKHHNSASRLYGIFANHAQIKSNTQVLSAWATSFGITVSKSKQRDLLVTERLVAVQREIDAVRAGMTASNYSSDLYEAALSAFEEATSPLLLPTTWDGVRQYLTPQNLLALNFCSEILPDEEEAISAEELKEILQLITELREIVDRSTLPDALVVIIRHHVELIEKALAIYPIAGVKALREAARAGLGELVESKETVSAHKGTEEISKLGYLWKKFNEVADAATKIDKAVQLGQKAWKLIESVIQSSS